VTNSNIEPLAREIAERICRRQGMSEAGIANWVEHHWECAAAMLEAGAMDEAGEWVEGGSLARGIEAYRDRAATVERDRS
jgi:hypothetical protein